VKTLFSITICFLLTACATVDFGLLGLVARAAAGK
jgi:starvation-inducible outer membrane lipoprotein